MANKYDRPKLTKEEADKCLAAARKIVAVQGRLGIATALTVLIGENMKLTKEVNLRRAAAGDELLPVHDLKV
jgi:hypothetical protein